MVAEKESRGGRNERMKKKIKESPLFRPCLSLVYMKAQGLRLSVWRVSLLSATKSKEKEKKQTRCVFFLRLCPLIHVDGCLYL